MTDCENEEVKVHSNVGVVIALDEEEIEYIKVSKLLIIQYYHGLRRLESALEQSGLWLTAIVHIDKIGEADYRVELQSHGVVEKVLEVLPTIECGYRLAAYEDLPLDKTGEVDWSPTNVYKGWYELTRGYKALKSS